MPDAPAPKVIQPTEDTINKWARKCHSQDDGHRRALMLSTHASTLAKLVLGVNPGAPGSDPELQPDLEDPWAAEQGTPPQSAAVKLPDKQAQISQRLKKLVYMAGLARMKHEYRGKVADTALDLAGRMQDHASKGLKGQLLRDYTNRVRSLTYAVCILTSPCAVPAVPGFLHSRDLLAIRPGQQEDPTRVVLITGSPQPPHTRHGSQGALALCRLPTP